MTAHDLDLRHYSIIKIDKLVKHYDSGKYGPPGKPIGFWVSVEGNGDGWRDWCTEQHVFTDQLAYEHKITLAPDANILVLSSPAELLKLTDDYWHESEINFGSHVMSLDWPRLAESYQGIIITPYIWSQRLEPRTFWYYGWDCASGCIWDLDAIANVELMGAVEAQP